jgi:hypothetical protein
MWAAIRFLIIAAIVVLVVRGLADEWQRGREFDRRLCADPREPMKPANCP